MLDAVDTTVRFVEIFFTILGKLYELVEYFMLLKMPNGMAIAIGCNALNGALTVQAMNAGKPPLYWIHSLVLVVFTAFGGGLLAPILAGRPCIPVANDLVIPLCVVFWYLTHHIPGLPKLLNFAPLKFVWTAGIGLFRAHAITNNVNATMAVLAAGPYYPIPLVGPILIGTCVGALGAFLPFDKGLAPIQNSCNWGIQAAFMTATFYHLMVNDQQGVLGTAMRSVMGNLSASTVLLIIAVLQVVHLELQWLLDPHCNLFVPVHKFLYMILNVKGPIRTPDEINKATHVGWNIRQRANLDHLVQFLRLLAVILVTSAHIKWTVPPVSLVANQTIGEGTVTIGSCQLFSSQRSCTPQFMQLEADTKNNHRLAVYQGKPDGEGLPVRFSASLLTKAGTGPAELTLEPSGNVVVKRDGKVVWSSKSPQCGEVAMPIETSVLAGLFSYIRSPRPTQLVLNPSTGSPMIQCAENAPNKVTFDLGSFL
jgi:hypothetical protein